MGYASYLEDIIDAGNDARELADNSRHQSKPARRNPRGRNRRRDLRSGYQQLIVVAAKLRSANAALSDRVRELELGKSDSERLHQNNVALRQRLRSVEEELRSERSRRKTAEFNLKEWERRLQDAPGGMQRMVDAYSTPADIDFFKFGERNR